MSPYKGCKGLSLVSSRTSAAARPGILGKINDVRKMGDDKDADVGRPFIPLLAAARLGGQRHTS